jgi:hypothetical protein
MAYIESIYTHTYHTFRTDCSKWLNTVSKLFISVPVKTDVATEWLGLLFYIWKIRIQIPARRLALTENFFMVFITSSRSMARQYLKLSNDHLSHILAN